MGRGAGANSPVLESGGGRSTTQVKAIYARCFLGRDTRLLAVRRGKATRETEDPQHTEASGAL
ncbi:hypothetical protein E2C01_054210 [Portunus trituberculatus]|uniref:Uncharacterized protein n=1 Tax=Portunus trituberculatus TaxID=210409 RepID=A0A5B7GMN4_PORTR|nr:hypothetical protein [Portunus trituberculatus]